MGWTIFGWTMGMAADGLWHATLASVPFTESFEGSRPGAQGRLGGTLTAAKIVGPV